MSRVEKALERASNRSVDSPVPVPERVPSHESAQAPGDDVVIRLRQPQSGEGEFANPRKSPLPFRDPAAAEPAQPAIEVPELAKSNSRLVIAHHASALGVDRFRECAAALQDIQDRSAWAGAAASERNFKSLLVTSARPGEGKTLTAVNLGLTFSEMLERRVLLIDAHLARPGVHALLDIPNSTGLADVLRSNDLVLPIQQVTSRLSVLTAGQGDCASDESLTLGRMRGLVADAVAQFDWVLVDGPAAHASDAPALAGVARAALLVIRSGLTSLREVDHAIAALGRNCIVGVVLNRVAHDVSSR